MLSDIQTVQNPALGAALIWRFAIGYIPTETAFKGVPRSLIVYCLTPPST